MLNMTTKTKLLTAFTALSMLPAAAMADVKTDSNKHDGMMHHIDKIDREYISFANQLGSEYARAADGEDNDWDIDDTRIMKDRSVAANNGYKVHPITLENINFVGTTESELTDARARLMRGLSEANKMNHPEIAARAQVAFDCWAIQQEAGPSMSHNLIDCKSRFEQYVAMLPTTTKAVTKPAKKMIAVNVADKDAVDVYFGFDESTLNVTARQRLTAFKDHIKDMNKDDVVIKGFADTSGPASYNQKLSMQRAQAVAEYLDISPNSANISITAYGEDNLPVSTADGVAAQANRVVKVMVKGTTKTTKPVINHGGYAN